MLESNKRKLTLCGWLKENGYAQYLDPLKLQKFLFFYEAFAKIHGEDHDFSGLYGYENGPVFTGVWADYMRSADEFERAITEVYNRNQSQVNEEWAKRALFAVSVLSDEELSDFTHRLNIWNAKDKQIESGETDTALSEDDFDEGDAKMFQLLERMYPIPIIDDCRLFTIGKYTFHFSKGDAARLTERHFDILAYLSNTSELHNPVYVEIEENGELVID